MGEMHEKHAEQLQSLQLGYEGRLGQLEAKLNINDRNMSSLVQKGDSGLSNINQWNEKLEQRV